MAEPEPSRRRFLRDALTGTAALIVAGCSPSRKRSQTTPRLRGTRLDVGDVDRIRASIATKRAPFYVAEARSYVSAFPPQLAGKVDTIYPPTLQPVLAAGLVVLQQRCPHLGCRVPWCQTSQWFECPCHGAKFDRVGEQRAGPSPRGLSLVRAQIEGGRLVLYSDQIANGVPVGTNTTHQAPEGPFCV